MEGIQTKRRTAQNRFWIVVIVLSILAVIYLLYKPGSKNKEHGEGAPSKINQGANAQKQQQQPQQPQSIFQKVQAVFQDDDYGDYDYTTTELYISDWQDRMGRPHYLAWDADYSTVSAMEVTTSVPEADTDDEADKEEESSSAAAAGKQELEAETKKLESASNVQQFSGSVQQGVSVSQSAPSAKIQLPSQSAETSVLLSKLKDLQPEAQDKNTQGVSPDMGLLKLTNPLQVNNIEFITSYRNPCFIDQTSGFQCFPAFFIAGMPRCETKALHTILDKHPSITAPDAHSPSFWTGRDQVPVGSYLEHFKLPAATIKSAVTKEGTKDTYKVLTFDSNPSLFWKGAIGSEGSFTTPLHLKHILPNSKIIIMVRDPIDRLYSEYMKFVPGGTPDSFDAFARSALEKLKKCEVDEKKLFSCIHKDLGDDSKPHLETGIYYLFYQEWIKSFTASQIMVVRTEDFKASTKETVSKVLKFLQIEGTTDSVLTSMLKDVTLPEEHLTPMKSSTKKFLYEFYQPYNNQFAQLLKNDALNYEHSDI